MRFPPMNTSAAAAPPSWPRYRAVTMMNSPRKRVDSRHAEETVDPGVLIALRDPPGKADHRQEHGEEQDERDDVTGHIDRIPAVRMKQRGLTPLFQVAYAVARRRATGSVKW